jgi:hypothetical protein
MSGDIEESVARGQGLKDFFDEERMWAVKFDEDKTGQYSDKQIIEGLIGGAIGIDELAAGQDFMVSADNARGLLAKMYSAIGIEPKVDTNTMGPKAITDAMSSLMEYYYDLPENE